jgi:hypothetical protein
MASVDLFVTVYERLSCSRVSNGRDLYTSLAGV